ncbi:P-loop containing nucleoside triphosphate hydrolase protein [Pseudomassariella vexata]|uniref:RNA helicase n=1 Tax=Pseudomassariella vexata TaxID=1141098 RepID=A0A1Y2EIY8_9PEZI|nr:P-loop containing nucleoside triphosphate hydrolase protein [Pseudomassariella vexata]ORY71417.1 P-loop containing nucleoside triphosphate hydrolase protein [Pseudomassariella vexata]
MLRLARRQLTIRCCPSVLTPTHVFPTTRFAAMTLRHQSEAAALRERPESSAQNDFVLWTTTSVRNSKNREQSRRADAARATATTSSAQKGKRRTGSDIRKKHIKLSDRAKVTKKPQGPGPADQPTMPSSEEFSEELPEGPAHLLASPYSVVHSRFRSIRGASFKIKTIQSSRSRCFQTTAVATLPGITTMRTMAEDATKKGAERAAALRIVALLHKEGLVEELWPQHEKLSAAVLTAEKDAIKDVYNYCARHLVVPQMVAGKRTRMQTKSYTCNIRLEEQGIEVSASATSVDRAEIGAALKFKAAAEGYIANTQAAGDHNGLTVDTASKFHEWLQMHRKSYDFDLRVDKTGGIFEAQVLPKSDRSGAPENSRIQARGKQLASDLALLCSAINICKAEPALLVLFTAAMKEGNGRIVRKLGPVTLEVPELAMNLMQRTVRATKDLRIAGAGARLTAIDESEQQHKYSTRQHLSQEQKRVLSQGLAGMYDRYLASDEMASMRKIKSELPMNKYKPQVYQLVEDNVFSIIIGATGSGKTTQVPQIILEQYYKSGKGAECNIMCTQPRRIAATSVASRVADEMGPELKAHVGHHVRFDARLPRQGGSVTYATTGILLQQLQSDPGRIFDHVSHLIIDEVHERDRIIDFTLTILKKAVAERLMQGLKVPRITLMSATLDTELFANYFKNIGPDGEEFEAPVLSVPGRTFPVTERHLDAVLDDLRKNYTQAELRVLDADKFSAQYLDIEHRFARGALTGRDDEVGVIDWKAKQNLVDNELGGNSADDAITPYGLIATTIAHVLRTTSDGAILVFFPGLDEMQRVEKLLQNQVLGVDMMDTSKYRTYLLHSSIPDAQKTVFNPVPPGVRKIILSTNIGETSITIPDVKHVIDTGKVRETRYDHVKRISALQSTWISKSNAKQRAGRAGRVQDGHYLALYTKARHQSMRAIGLPELLRSDLQTTCLNIKSSIPGVDVTEFLAAAIEPPSAASVKEALKNLADLGALTRDHGLTALGKLLASLPVHPALGKMILLGVLFKCLDPIMVVGAAAEERGLFITAPDVRSQSAQNKVSYAAGSESDHLALYNAFCDVRDNYSPQDERRARDVAYKELIHFGAWKSVYGAAQQMEQIFLEAGLISRPEEWEKRDRSRMFGGKELNKHSHKSHIVKAILLAGLQPNVAIATGREARIWRTFGEPVSLLPQTSVLTRAPPRSTQDGARSNPILVTFTNLVKSTEGSTFLRDASTVNPLAVALFASKLTQVDGSGPVITANEWLPFFVRCERSGWHSANNLLQFRTSLNKMLMHAFGDLAHLGKSTRDGGRKGIHDSKLRSDVFDAAVAVLDVSERSKVFAPGPSRDRVETNRREVSPDRLKRRARDAKYRA